MAEKDLDLDVKPAGSKKKLIILFAVLAIVLAAASVGLTLWMLGGDKSGEDDAKAQVIPVAHYMALDNMVVNFAQRGPARFLQVEMQLMAHEQAVFRTVEQHMPVIRNDLLVLLGGVSYEEASTREGKEALNRAILESINGILQQQGASGQIQAVYFTSFVMQ